MDNLPLGFAFSLSMNKNAMDYYNTLDYTTQEKLTNYIETAKNTQDTKLRIEQSISALNSGDINFLNIIE